ncbi:GNAT family N-acetyltransferase [Falsibacillus pallidus]|uniref:GNAT family N-acetyltransferase n=1 Tax=Falsibacillus pallidus TaxID=493781 RepID=UPI003D9720DE
MLTSKQLNDIEKLQKECEAHDGIQLKLNWEMLKDRDSDQLDFFYYEGDELIGFLGLYGFGSTVEVCGMVKPSERRKGHFKKLFHDGMESVKNNGFKRILLNTPAGSASGKSFVKSVGAEHKFSEHQMKWQEQPLKETEGFTLRPAVPEDLDARVHLSVTGFGVSEADAREMESRQTNRTNTQVYMIDVDDSTIGKIRISLEEDGKEAWIYGFAISPEQRGKGIGRKVLNRIVKDHITEGRSVHLEVETKNDHALGLYESVGFKTVHAQEYYSYSI